MATVAEQSAPIKPGDEEISKIDKDRAEQGLPPTIEDPVVIARVAALILS